jgi:hypothetical protein
VGVLGRHRRGLHHQPSLGDLGMLEFKVICGAKVTSYFATFDIVARLDVLYVYYWKGRCISEEDLCCSLCKCDVWTCRGCLVNGGVPGI